MRRAEIVAYAPHHRAAILEIQKRLWSPSTELNDRYFQWKFVDNPNAGSGALFLALSHGRLVGMRGYMGSLWRDPAGGLVSIPLAGDTVVASDHEGLGIVNGLSDAARDEFTKRGIDVVLNTSASPAIHLHSSRAGWKTIGQYARMRRRPQPPSSGPFGRTLQKFWPSRKKPIGDPFPAANGKEWRQEGSTISLKAAIEPEAASALCSQIPSAPSYTMVRDSAFFRWRFSNPLRTYYFLTCRKGGRLEAYLALSSRMADGGPDVRIVDWNYRDRPQFRHLLAALARFVPHVGVNILVNACNGEQRHDLLAAGFRDIMPRKAIERFEHRPGVLGLPTRADNPVFQTLSREGFAILEFKGIESDGA